jgi:hypothetical protein
VKLERGTIEKSDFPLVDRGYDPAAVREHLQGLADEVERLQDREAQAGEQSTSASAAEHVRGILAAAEEAAAEIKRQGSERAREIVGSAEREAGEIRAGAGEAVRRQAASGAHLTADLIDRDGRAQGELAALAIHLRSAAERLGSGQVRTEPEEPAADAPAPATRSRARNGSRARNDDASAPATAETAPETLAQPAGPEAAEAEAAAIAPAPAPNGGEGTPGASARADVDGARLVALNMALNGEPREETDRYLAENFDLPDRGALVEEVYAAIET